VYGLRFSENKRGKKISKLFPIKGKLTPASAAKSDELTDGCSGLFPEVTVYPK
jgi:hypothetical protein